MVASGETLVGGRGGEEKVECPPTPATSSMFDEQSPAGNEDVGRREAIATRS